MKRWLLVLALSLVGCGDPYDPGDLGGLGGHMGTGGKRLTPAEECDFWTWGNVYSVINSCDGRKRDGHVCAICRSSDLTITELPHDCLTTKGGVSGQTYYCTGGTSNACDECAEP